MAWLPGAEADAEVLDEITALGGVQVQLLSHGDEASRSLEAVRERFGSRLACSAVEVDQIDGYAEGLSIDLAWTPDCADEALDGLEIMATPGHTRGSISVRYESPHGRTYLFTGDTIVPKDEGGWATAVAEGQGGTAADLERTLLALREQSFDLLASSAYVGETSTASPSQESGGRSSTTAWSACASGRLLGADAGSSLNATPDRYFAEPRLAELYDSFSWHRRDFDFYLPLLMSAERVLDVGCGTGELLHLARETGHDGRLCGLDPAEAMLEQARRRSDIEWLRGDLSSVDLSDDFDLVVMTGHAFQVFVGDDELRDSLLAIRRALAAGGRFAFETRNPLARAWEHWTPEHAAEIVYRGNTVRMETRVETPVTGELVSFTHTFSSPDWDGPETSRSTLRFIDIDSLSALLTESGFSIEAQFGDWERQPLTDASPEIITIARRA